MYPIIIPTSYMGDPLLYTKSYLDEYLGGEETSKRSKIPWIGSIPAHFLQETHLELSIIQQMILDPTLQEDSKIKVLGFWNPFVFRSVAQRLSEDYPGLYDILEYSLLSLGERKEDIAKLHTLTLFKAFYGLSFVARPDVLIEFTNWLSRVMMFIFSDPTAHTMLWNHIPENLSVQSASSVLGERLAPYFMNSRGYDIIKNPKEYQDVLHKRNILNRCRSERDMIPPGLGEKYDVSIFYHIGMLCTRNVFERLPSYDPNKQYLALFFFLCIQVWLIIGKT
jgi:hypothetical protein